jgi:hypothetical protein
MIPMPSRKARSGDLDRIRVVRGGSWNNNQDNARAANRNWNNNHNNNLGFRVVCASAMFFRPSCGMGQVASCGTTQMAYIGVRVPEMQQDHGFVAEVKQEEQRRIVWSARRLKSSATRGHRVRQTYTKAGSRLDENPTRPALDFS